ncbi:MAG: hypothetical protein NC396_07750 [Bacteroides sp.]|nr:hypothetical protein [Bacteroides sp.]MCM1086151.1 hypothetical protein [Bacteroides sp.]
MGVIFFTLLAVALGCGVGSKARKDKKQYEKRRRQGTVPAGGEAFPSAGRIPVQTISDTLGNVPEEPLERLEEEFSLESPSCEEAFEAGRYEEVMAREDAECREEAEKGRSENDGFSLREAVIAQAVLERKYH